MCPGRCAPFRRVSEWDDSMSAFWPVSAEADLAHGVRSEEKSERRGRATPPQSQSALVTVAIPPFIAARAGRASFRTGIELVRDAEAAAAPPRSATLL